MKKDTNITERLAKLYIKKLRRTEGLMDAKECIDDILLLDRMASERFGRVRYQLYKHDVRMNLFNNMAYSLDPLSCQMECTNMGYEKWLNKWPLL